MPAPLLAENLTDAKRSPFCYTFSSSVTYKGFTVKGSFEHEERSMCQQSGIFVTNVEILCINMFYNPRYN
jgi:hypothetical protein